MHEIICYKEIRFCISLQKERYLGRNLCTSYNRGKKRELSFVTPIIGSQRHKVLEVSSIFV